MYKRLHHAPVHEDALFKVHVHSLLPEEKRDLMCLLQDFVADLERRPLSDIHGGFDNSPSFSKLQRKSVSPPDASAQSGSCGCASMAASKLNPTRSSPGCSTQNPAQPKEVFTPEKEGPQLCIPNISSDALRKNWNSITNRIRTKVAQEVDLISPASGSSAHAHIVRKSAIDSVNNRETSVDDQKEHRKGESNIARWISDSPLEEYSLLARSPQPGATDTQDTVTGSEWQAKTISQQTSDWTIIFYNQAGFYTDLSGDIGSMRVKERSYDCFLSNPIGAKTHLEGLEELRQLEYRKGPLSQPDTDTAGAYGSASSLVVNDVDWEAFAFETPCQSNFLSDTFDPPRFEVSGLGGVVPSDHFSITIRSCLYARNANMIFPTRAAQHSRPYRYHVLSALEDSSSGFPSFSTSVSEERSFVAVQRDIIDFQVKKLPPSCLPPPSYYAYESSEGDEGPDGSEDSTEESE